MYVHNRTIITGDSHMKVIKMKKKREYLTQVYSVTIFLIGFLIFCDVDVMINATGSRPVNFIGWISFLFVHVFILGFSGIVIALIVPDFLAVYTDEGIKWPTLTGYKFIPWSEVTSAEDQHTFWRRRKIILTSPQKKIVINPEIFQVEEEVVDVIKKHVPTDLWKS